MPRELQYKGRTSSAISFGDSKHISDFLDVIAETYSLDLPGRVPGKFGLS